MKESITYVMDLVDKFSGPSQKVMNSASGMDEELSNLNDEMLRAKSVGADLNHFDKLNRKMKLNSESLSSARKEASMLGAEYSSLEKPTKAQTAAFEKSKKTVGKFRYEQEKLRLESQKLGAQMKKAGIDTSKFTTEQKKADLAIRKTTSAVDNHISALKKRGEIESKYRARADKYGGSNGAMKSGAVAGAGLAASGAAVAIGAAHLSNQDTADQSRVADGYGLTLAEMQKNNYVGSKAGLDGEAMADMGEEMKNKLGEFFANGKQGSVEDLVKKTGIDLNSLKGMSTGDQMAAIMAEIGKVEDKDEQQFLMDDLFSGEAAKLHAYMTKNKVGYADLTKESERYALATADGTKGALEYSDAMKDFSLIGGAAFSDIAGIAGGYLAPEIKKAADSLRSFFTGNKAEVVEMTKGFIDGSKAVVMFLYENRELIALVAKVGVGLVALKITVMAVSTVVSVISGLMAAYTAAMGAAGIATAFMAGAMAILTSPITLIIGAVALLVGAVWFMYNNWEKVASKMAGPWLMVGKIIGSVFGGIADFIGVKVDWIMGKISAIIDFAKSAYGYVSNFFGGDEDQDQEQRQVTHKPKMQISPLKPMGLTGGASAIAGNSSNDSYTFSISGAQDPQAVGSEIERILAKRDRDQQRANRGRLGD